MLHWQIQHEAPDCKRERLRATNLKRPLPVRLVFLKKEYEHTYKEHRDDNFNKVALASFCLATDVCVKNKFRIDPLEWRVCWFAWSQWSWKIYSDEHTNRTDTPDIRICSDIWTQYYYRYGTNTSSCRILPSIQRSVGWSQYGRTHVILHQIERSCS